MEPNKEAAMETTVPSTADIIAVRRLIAVDDGAELELAVYVPVRRAPFWSCTARLAATADPENPIIKVEIGGVDGLQALELAIEGIRGQIRQRGLRVRWVAEGPQGRAVIDAGGAGISLLIPAFDGGEAMQDRVYEFYRRESNAARVEGKPSENQKKFPPSDRH